MKQIRAGIIGQGRSGHNIHAAHMVTVPEMYKIVAVSDPLEEMRERAKKEFGCAVYEDYKEMAARKDLDIIVNASPSQLHVPISIDLLNMGCNVLCEKPLSNKSEDLDRLEEAIKKSGKFFTVFQNMRFAPEFQKIKQVIESEVLGRIVQISIYEGKFGRRWDWQTLQANNGGTLSNNGVHLIDQALQLLGTDVDPEVDCRLDRANTFGDANDYAKVILKSPGRPLIDIEVSSCCCYPQFLYSIQGTCGSLICKDSRRLDWKFFKPEEAPKQKLTLTPIVDANGIPEYCNETLKWYEDSWDMPKEFEDQDTAASKEYYDALYKTLAEGAPAQVTLKQIRQQVKVLQTCLDQNPLSRIM